MSPVSGTSVDTPHCLAPADVYVYPLEEVSQNQVPESGRHTIRSARPSPSMSPINGLSVEMPQARAPAAAGLPPLVDGSQNQVPLLGLHTTRSARPSPSKSSGVSNGTIVKVVWAESGLTPPGLAAATLK